MHNFTRQFDTNTGLAGATWPALIFVHSHRSFVSRSALASPGLRAPLQGEEACRPGDAQADLLHTKDLCEWRKITVGHVAPKSPVCVAHRPCDVAYTFNFIPVCNLKNIALLKPTHKGGDKAMCVHATRVHQPCTVMHAAESFFNRDEPLAVPS